VDEAKNNGGRTLVACAAGVSRSATLVLAYLMKREGLSLPVACTLVRSVRPIVQPNHGFMWQLVEFEVIIFFVAFFLTLLQGAGRRVEVPLQDCLLHESVAEAARRRSDPRVVCRHGLVWECEQVVGLAEGEDLAADRFRYF
jgi:hypothetical protein